jgi:hypothetical protein
VHPQKLAPMSTTSAPDELTDKPAPASVALPKLAEAKQAAREDGGISLLSGVTRGRKTKPIFGLIYGGDGVGKTTFGENSPVPIFSGAEPGLELVKAAKFPKPTTLSQFRDQFMTLYREEHEYKSFVVDSVDWLEPIIWARVCEEGHVDSIELYEKGFGKGYVRASEIWRGVLRELAQLSGKMNVILIGHALVKKFEDPDTPSGYDRYILKVQERSAALIREAVDVVLFAKFETNLTSGGRPRGIGDGSRVMFTEQRPAFDAKNRYQLPFEMKLEWQPFEDAVKAFYQKK